MANDRQNKALQLKLDDALREQIKEAAKELSKFTVGAQEAQAKLKALFDTQWKSDSLDAYYGKQKEVLTSAEQAHFLLMKQLEAQRALISAAEQHALTAKDYHETLSANEELHEQQIINLKKIGVAEETIKAYRDNEFGAQQALKLELDEIVNQHKKLVILYKAQNVAQHEAEASLDEVIQKQAKVDGLASSIASRWIGIGKSIDTTGTALVASLTEGGQLFEKIGRQMNELVTKKNLLMSTQKKGEELLAMSFQTNVDYYNRQQEMMQRTGMDRDTNADEIQSINDSVDAMNKLGITSEEVISVRKTLRAEMAGFVQASVSEQGSIANTITRLKRLGIEEATAGRAMGNMTKSMGMGQIASAKMTQEIAMFAKAMKMDTNPVLEKLNSNWNYFALFSGKQAIERFKELSIVSQKTGIEVDKLAGFAQKFDTFEDASAMVGQFNALMRGPFLNTLDLVNEKDGAKRFKMVQDAMKSAGMEWDSLEYSMKNAMAEIVTNGDVDQLGKMMNNQTDDVENLNAKLKEQAKDLELVLDFTSKGNATTNQMAVSTAEMASGMTKLNDTLASAIQWLSGFQGTIVKVAIGLQMASAAVTIFGGVRVMGAFIASLAAGGGAMGTFGAGLGVLATRFATMANAARMAGFAAGYFLSKVGDDNPGSTGEVLGDIGAGAAYGAAVGSFFGPGIGTVVGGAIGGLAGGVSNLFSTSAFAEGTDSAPGGLAIVGEKGPEVVSLPQNSSVINNSNTNQIVNALSKSQQNSSNSVNNNNSNSNMSVLDGSKAAKSGQPMIMNITLKLDKDVLAKHTREITREEMEQTLNIVA